MKSQQHIYTHQEEGLSFCLYSNFSQGNSRAWTINRASTLQEELLYLEKSIRNNPYQSINHKRYALALQEYAQERSNNRHYFFHTYKSSYIHIPSKKEEILILAQSHYERYQTLRQIDNFLSTGAWKSQDTYSLKKFLYLLESGEYIARKQSSLIRAYNRYKNRGQKLRYNIETDQVYRHKSTRDDFSNSLKGAYTSAQCSQKSPIKWLIISLLLLIPFLGSAQNIATVQGTITDQNSEPVHNARLIFTHELSGINQDTSYSDTLGYYTANLLLNVSIAEEKRKDSYVYNNPGADKNYVVQGSNDSQSEVYNNLGQVVRIIDNNVFGNHIKGYWDGNNNSGQQANPGIYFIRTEKNNGTVEVMKVIHTNCCQTGQQAINTQDNQLKDMLATNYVVDLDATNFSGAQYMESFSEGNNIKDYQITLDIIASINGNLTNLNTDSVNNAKIVFINSNNGIRQDSTYSDINGDFTKNLIINGNEGTNNYYIEISGQDINFNNDTTTLTQGNNTLNYTLEQKIGEIYFSGRVKRGTANMVDAKIEMHQLGNQDTIYQYTSGQWASFSPQNIPVYFVNQQMILNFTPSDTLENHQFMNTTDTLTITQTNGYIGAPDFEMTPIPQHQDLTFKLRDGYTRNDLSGFIIRVKDQSNMTLIDTLITNANGEGTFQNVPANTTLYLEYGGNNNYYASKGNLWNMPTTIKWANDTIASDTVKIALFPKNVIIPQTNNDPAPATIDSVSAAEINEMIRGPPGNATNSEEAMGRQIRLHLDPSWTPAQKTSFTNTLTQTDSLYYGNNTSPFTIVTTAINVNEMTSNYVYNYNHITNFYPDTLGWNIRDGPPVCDAKTIVNYEINKINNENSDKTGTVIGGVITLSPGTFSSAAKELYGRRTYMGNVTSRASMMNDSNDNGGVPTLKDRAIYHMKINSDKNRYVYKIDYYPLQHIFDSL